jgi:hypothetical protein
MHGTVWCVSTCGARFYHHHNSTSRWKQPKHNKDSEPYIVFQSVPKWPLSSSPMLLVLAPCLAIGMLYIHVGVLLVNFLSTCEGIPAAEDLIHV